MLNSEERDTEEVEIPGLETEGHLLIQHHFPSMVRFFRQTT